MTFYNGFEESVFKDIARRSLSQQAVKDVSYQRLVIYRKARESYAERIDDVACLFGYYNSDHMHIVCVAVDITYQRKGLASALLYRAMDTAKQRGLTKVRTRTRTGKLFYERNGFIVIGKKGDDYLMEAIL